VVWPIVSLVLGLVFGTLVGVEMTLMVFGITLIRLPLHIAKTLYITATTATCFSCAYFDPFLRVVVFFLVPIPHLLRLCVVTFGCLTLGTLYYIGKATKTIFKGSYAKAWSDSWTNLLLEKDSRLGSYIDSCQDFVESDHPSESIIWVLKTICSFPLGIPLGALPFVPFTIAIVLITLYRLPVNVYLTLRVAVRTVTLKWDLKLLALVLLPVIHTLFPLVVFAVSLVGSFGFFVICTSMSITEGESPFQEWGHFQERIQEYYEAHQEFVGEKCLGRFDHPTGIPSGWRGQTYGLPIHKLLLWQWDFLVSFTLLLVGLPICLAGSAVIFSVKLVPGILSWWRKLYHLLIECSLAEILGYWAFWLCGFILTPAVAVVVSIGATFIGTLLALRIPYDYIKHGCAGGLYAPLRVLRDVDGWDIFFLNGCRVFACLPNDRPYKKSSNSHYRSCYSERKAEKEARRLFAKAYWNRFAQQCTSTTAALLEAGWITIDDIQGFDSSVLQAVPAVAILNILVDSINDPEAKTADHISWALDGTNCTTVDKNQLDNIAALLWPKVLEVKRILRTGRKKKKLAQEQNATILAAMLCANSEEPTDALEAFLKDQEQNHKSHAANIRLRSKLTELSLMILQVQPFQERMQGIFSHDYTRETEEGALLPDEQHDDVADDAAIVVSPWQKFVYMCKQALDGELLVGPA